MTRNLGEFAVAQEIADFLTPLVKDRRIPAYITVIEASSVNRQRQLSALDPPSLGAGKIKAAISEIARDVLWADKSRKTNNNYNKEQL